MSEEELLKKLKELADVSDTESAHCDADNLLVQFLATLGYAEVVAAYEEVPKWYA